MGHKYIDADVLEEAVLKIGYWDNRDEQVVYDLVDSMNAADVEPVRHGEWKYIYTNGFWRCSECGYPQLGNYINSKYCPNCGAKMDGGSE